MAGSSIIRHDSRCSGKTHFKFHDIHDFHKNTLLVFYVLINLLCKFFLTETWQKINIHIQFSCNLICKFSKIVVGPAFRRSILSSSDKYYIWSIQVHILLVEPFVLLLGNLEQGRCQNPRTTHSVNDF